MNSVSLSILDHNLIAPLGPCDPSPAAAAERRSETQKLQIFHWRIRLFTIRLTARFPRRANVLFVFAHGVAATINPIASGFASTPRMMPRLLRAFFRLSAQCFPSFCSGTRSVQNSRCRANAQSRQKPYQTTAAVVRHGGLQSIGSKRDGSTRIDEIQTVGVAMPPGIPGCMRLRTGPYSVGLAVDLAVDL